MRILKTHSQAAMQMRTSLSRNACSARELGFLCDTTNVSMRKLPCIERKVAAVLISKLQPNRVSMRRHASNTEDVISTKYCDASNDEMGMSSFWNMAEATRFVSVK